MSMKHILIISYSLIVAGIIVLGILSVMMNSTQHQLSQHQSLRYQSYLLADQLRQSSDDLTRMARTYVVTQDERYAQYYWDILAIRNGEKPRPQQYNRIYWDLVLNIEDQPRPEGETIALRELMIQAGFTQAELNKLKEAQDNSDGLVKIETVAMNAIKGRYEDETGRYSIQKAPDPALAIQLMHGEQYHAYKAEIMRPIDEFFQLINARTQARVDYYQQRSDVLLLVIRINVLLLAILTIIVGVWVTRWILYQVGGEPQQIAQIAHEVANGQLEVKFADKNKASGVYAAIQRMVKNLQFIISETRCHLEQLAEGNMEIRLSENYIGDFAEIRNALENTAHRLGNATTQNEHQNWLKTGQMQLSEQISGEQDVVKLSEKIIQFLAHYLNMQVGTLFLAQPQAEQEAYLKLFATYAHVHRKTAQNRYHIGEGLVGQAALEQKLFTIAHPPEDYLPIHSSLGETLPRMLVVAPFMYEGELKGVLELGGLQAFSESHLEFLNQVLPAIAIAIHSAQSRTQMQQLLAESRTQAEQLALKQQALQETNEELQSQSEELQTQQEELQSQQEELRQTNEELEMRSRELERQRSEIEQKNAQLERIQAETLRKAEQLANASQYKSEFLANMSHELRTPLNSLLILSQILAENKEGNLNDKQIEYATTIFNAGNDLLGLINDILDLSKVEAGKLTVHQENIVLTELAASMQDKFQPIADNKDLAFNINIAEHLPSTVVTDGQRLGQIISNLLSNAFKFTEVGRVSLNFNQASDAANLSKSGLTPDNTLAISITDTGVGVPEDKQASIFEAFQQADGTTSRRYGGTGLGLSISIQLAKLLGGEIQLHSQLNQGSTFTLYLPFKYTDTAVRLASSQAPTVVTDSVLATESETMAYPVLADQVTEPPIRAPEYKILLLTDNITHQQAVHDVLHGNDIALLSAEHYDKAQHLLQTEHLDCVVLDAEIAQQTGLKWLQQQCEAGYFQSLTVIIYVQRQLTSTEKVQFDGCQTCGLSTQVQVAYSAEQLLDAVTLLLHQVAADIPQVQQHIMHKIHNRVDVLANKKVLLVDDDIRNLFSISAVLEEKNVQVIEASNGQEALDKIAQHPDTDLVLMDIMMPEMDGYAATKAIRKTHNARKLPIIALTAKAMKGDKAKCIEAGANDYLAKPIDNSKLLSLMRVWLYH